MVGGRARWLAAAILLLMVSSPLIPASPGQPRAPPVITMHLDTLSTGSGEEVAVLDSPGNNTSLALTLPNGARVLSARFNVTGLPLAEGGLDYPRNVTVDAGPSAPVEWAFRGTGYGRLGHQNEFANGSPRADHKCGMNSVNTSFFHLPKSAHVLSANCTLNGTPANNVTITGTSASGHSVPFGSTTNRRAQWLYLASEVGTSGYLDKVAWKVVSGIGGSATYTNFKLLACNISNSSLSSTLDDNYGGAAPVTLIDSASFSASEANGWLTFELPDTFFYDNSKNLLLEVMFDSRTGSSFTLRYTTGFSGNRMAYSYVSGTTTYKYAYGYRYDCAQDFFPVLNLSVDVLNDSVIDYQTTGLPWAGANLEFTGPLNDYLAAAPANFTDRYGNAFVTVPIRLWMEYSGRMTFSGLSIAYSYNATVEKVQDGADLVDALVELLPGSYDGRRTNITLEIAATSPGRVRISDVSIDYRPPVHPPFIDLRTPAKDLVVMDENSSVEFSIVASDEYGYPLNSTWYIDGMDTQRDVWSLAYNADFESAGPHTVGVRVDNGLGSASAFWNVTVRNVNRPPAIISAQPGPQVTINEEESVTLSVVAQDPDSQDPQLRYAWYVDNIDQAAGGESFNFRTNLTMAGLRTVRTVVTDSGGLTAASTWRVTVLNVNVAPVVDAVLPNLNPTIRETQSVVFSVTAHDFDRQALAYRWYLDGAEAATGPQWMYHASYDAAGTHIVQVVVSDGEANVTRNWTVTVEDVNRPPAAVIDRPAPGAEAMDMEPFKFSGLGSSDPDGDALRYTWLEGGRVISTAAEFEQGFGPGTREVTLEVTDGKRGTDRATVKLMVRFIRLAVNIGWDDTTPTEGDRLSITAWVNNTGDANASSVGVEFLVDGRSMGTQTIEAISGGGRGSASIPWTARRGEHTLTVKIGARTWNSTLAVAERPAPPPADITLPAVLAIVAAAVCGGILFAVRRARGARRGAGPAAAPPPKPAASRAPPGAPSPAAPAPEPPLPAASAPEAAAPEAAGPPAPAEPPLDMEKRDQALRLIISTQERMAALASNGGAGATAAAVALDRAKAQVKVGNYDRAVLYAKQARLALSSPPPGEATSPPPPPAVPGCPGCGESLEPGWSVCPGCGRPV